MEAEAEGCEPGRMLDGGDQESGGAVTAASSVTEPESQDMVELLLRTRPELNYAGNALPLSHMEMGPVGFSTVSMQ